MTNIPGAALRQRFTDFFAAQGHTVVPSAPLLTRDDPTLMFVNAGMVPFKDIFSGQQQSAMRRATSCQKCMRVSGKHNDLEEVGRTARHHTFFEMLGNFSFGDYFKEAAITYAWRFIRQELALDPKRLWITVYAGDAQQPADAEARRLWRQISGLPESRILEMGAADNFWQMGERGPCGPCTEIYYDQGSGPVGPQDFESGRVMEIWNNVFMQFDRQADGRLVPLPAPSVDTGMGFERVAAVLQGADSNYHSDLFAPLFATLQECCGKPYGRSASDDDVSMRVLADHARSTAFLVADGVIPGNEGPGYVLRRLMRRAIRHGRRLGAKDDALAATCAAVVAHMGGAYPELPAAGAHIDQVARGEAEAFSRTLDTGLKIFAEAASQARTAGRRELAGDALFRLYDTYGFPVDLSAVLAEEQGLQLDRAGFDAAMAAQKERSRGSAVGGAAVQGHYKELLRQLGPSRFCGGTHESLPVEARGEGWRRAAVDGQDTLQVSVEVVGLLHDGAAVSHVAPSGDAPLEVEVVLQPTPFYGEAGGQAGDTGHLVADGLRAAVLDTQRPLPELTVSRVALSAGRLQVGQRLWAAYAPQRRLQIRAHHSATHLLHGALRAVLGEHVGQAGSFVGPDYLRFDFSHPSALTLQQRQAVEAHVAARIATAAPAHIVEVSQQEARELGAIAMFGEKYGERVRVITLADSIELCGGTHVASTAEVDLLLVVAEQAVKSGVRRIEAVVGNAARHLARHRAALLRRAHGLLLGLPADVLPPIRAASPAELLVLEQVGRLSPPTGGAAQPPAELLLEPFDHPAARLMVDLWEALAAMCQAKPADLPTLLAPFAERPQGAVLRALEAASSARRQRDQGRAADASRQLAELARQLSQRAEPLGNTTWVCARVDGTPAASLRLLADELRQHMSSGVVVLAAAEGSKVALLVAVTADLAGRLPAGKLIRAAAPHIGGRGGGRPEMAQAGGSQPDGIAAAFAALRAQVEAATAERGI